MTQPITFDLIRYHAQDKAENHQQTAEETYSFQPFAATGLFADCHGDHSWSEKVAAHISQYCVECGVQRCTHSTCEKPVMYGSEGTFCFGHEE